MARPLVTGRGMEAEAGWLSGRATARPYKGAEKKQLQGTGNQKNLPSRPFFRDLVVYLQCRSRWLSRETLVIMCNPQEQES